MAFVGVTPVYLIPDRIATRTYQKAKDNLRIGILAVLGPAGNADVIFAGFEVHRGCFVEDYSHVTSQHLPGLIVRDLLYIVFNIVGVLALGFRPPSINLFYIMYYINPNKSSPLS